MQGEFEFYRSLPRRPAQPERLFFALLPDAAAARRVERFVERFARENRLTGARLGAGRLHLSLHGLGDCPRLPTEALYRARRAAQTVSMPPFEVTFPFIVSFGHPAPKNGFSSRRPLALLGAGNALRDLHESLGAALMRNGLKTSKSFTPHMTVLYGSPAVPLRPIEPISFAVREFALVHSELWLTRYNILGRWALEEEAAKNAPSATR